MRRARWPGLLVAGTLAACAGKGASTTGTGGGGAATTATGTTGGFGTGAGGGCGLGGASDAGAGCAGLSGGVKFSTDVAPIFAGCTGEACHGALTYGTTVGKVSTECCSDRLIVSPGDANHSYLVDKIRGHHLCGGRAMPLDLPPLPATDQDTLVRWICEGAPND